MKRVLIGVAVLAVLLAAVAGMISRPAVSVKVLDPRFHFRNAWVSHWSPTSTNEHWEMENPWLRYAKSYAFRLERKCGLTKASRPNYLGPVMGWSWSPGYWECDYLVLFGTRSGGDDNFLFLELCDTNGACISGGGESAYATDIKGMLTNDFGWTRGIPTNLHGAFLLKMREATNALAVVTIR